ncbi:fused DSP-PTPase phosphatase/NAD kinase-like protein [Dokdonella immobilis]|uniref:TIGR01244 family protein n=1 Tax=Dokdonella immobilis TaxID=578942 RepID=A0A1I4VTE3_9GAMM|nr:sulfur transferase domain-containing protein [Dokdonella immobilis]SFN04266.1 TIGR01244 family protein [Dokdonella immobilis]
MDAPFPYADGHYAGGQPTPAQLAGLARAGVRTVINLRAPDEPVEYDEAAEAARLGLHYVPLPITGAADLDRERVRQFGRALDEARRAGGVLIHCASANRVGAIVALDEVFNRGCPLHSALERGREAGLKALEPAVVMLAQHDGAQR